MDKAEGWLKAQGWKKGQGLGRHGQGMATHVKVSLKKNTHGIGAVGNQWGDDWWDKMYDNTLSSLDIEEEKGKVKVNSTSGANGNLEVSIQKYRIQQYKGLLYGHFTKSREPLVNLLDAQKAREAADGKSSGDSEVVHTPGAGLGSTTTQEKPRKATARDSDSDSDSDSESDSEETLARRAQLEDCIHHLNTDKTFKACKSRVLRRYVPVGKLQRIAMQDAAFAANGSAADGVISMTIETSENGKESGKKRKRSSGEGDAGKKRRTSEGSGAVLAGKEAKRVEKEKKKQEKKQKKAEDKKERKRLEKEQKRKLKKDEKKKAKSAKKKEREE